MRKTSLFALFVMTFFAASTLLVTDADARRKRRKKKKTKVMSKAHAKALRDMMGTFKFGMSPDEVVQTVTGLIKERYAAQIASTNDVYEQDKLRTKQKQEIKRLKKSMVHFKGKKTGWDVSIIDDQFAHKTDESMMVQWETHQGKNQRRFFFFHEGELYKMFIALDTSQMGKEQKNFKFFQRLMENRFGKGKPHDTGLSWKLKDIWVDAIDKLVFYNSFCLLVTDPKRFRYLASVREERGTKTKDNSNILNSVTEGVDREGPDLDEGSDVLDRVLGDL